MGERKSKMIGKLWSTGIILEYGHGGTDKGTEFHGWWASVEISDDGFCEKGSVRGWMTTAYASDIDHAIRTIHDDVKKMGVEFVGQPMPSLHIKGDGEDPSCQPPDGWKEILKEAAEKIGFESIYC